MRLRAGRSAAALARLAFLHRRNADLDVAAARRVLERQLEVVAKVGAAIHAVAARAAALLAEDLAEDVAERIGEAAESFGAARAGRAESCRRIDAGVAELVVRRALLRASDRISYASLASLKLVLGALFRIAIRMVLHRELAISLLDVVFRCIAVTPSTV